MSDNALELTVQIGRHIERLEACQRPGPMIPAHDTAALRAAAQEVRVASLRARTPPPRTRRR